MKWEPIKNAPTDGAYVLVTFASTWCYTMNMDEPGAPYIAIAYRRDDGRWFDEEDYCISTPTHYMPLSPPEV